MTISQITARSIRPVAQAGHQSEVNSNDRTDWAINSVPQTKQVTTITVGGSPGSAQEYTITINGVDVVTTAPTGSPTTGDVAIAMAAAINAEPLVRGAVSAVRSSATVVVTSTVPGLAFTLTESETDLSLASTTANDEADAIPMGRLVVSTSVDSDDGIEKLCSLPTTSAVSAQVDSYVLTYDAAVNIIVSINVLGEQYEASHTMATDVDTSGAAIVAALNAILPAESVVATYLSASDTMVLTAEIEGLSFVSSVTFGPGRDTGAAVKTSTAGKPTDLSLAAAGVSILCYDEEVTTAGGTAISYPANAGVKYLVKGKIWVTSTESISKGDRVYVELATGLFFKSSGTDRVLLPVNKAVWCRSVSADSLAELLVDFSNN